MQQNCQSLETLPRLPRIDSTDLSPLRTIHQSDSKLPEIKDFRSAYHDSALHNRSRMSPQLKPKKISNSLSVQEFCKNMTGHPIFESTTVNYPVVGTEMLMYRKDRYQSQWKKENGRRNTYVDQIFAQAKKPERITPAPTAYSADRTKFTMPRSLDQKLSKEKRVMYIDQVMREEKKKVGPNAYKSEYAFDYVRKPKVKGVYLGQNKNPTQGLLNDQEFA